jgi:hypothetical protein
MSALGGKRTPRRLSQHYARMAGGGRMLTKLSRRWGGQAREQNWFAVAIDFVIVVAGVFLAIQAANWNDSRKARAEERRYYAQILDDLRADQQTLQLALRQAAKYDAAAENTLRAIRSGIPPNSTPGRFAVDIHHAGFLYIPRTSRRTYDELISSGKLGLLQNEAAKAAIADYYSKFDEIRQWDGLLRAQQDRYWEATSGVLPRPVLRDAIRFREPVLSADDADRILTALRERDGIDDMLVSMAAHQERVRTNSEYLAVKLRVLIAKLKPLAGS